MKITEEIKQEILDSVREFNISMDEFKDYFTFQNVNVLSNRVTMVFFNYNGEFSYNFIVNNHILNKNHWFSSQYYYADKIAIYRVVGKEQYFLYDENLELYLPTYINKFYRKNTCVVLVKYNDDEIPYINIINRYGQLASEQWFNAIGYGQANTIVVKTWDDDRHERCNVLNFDECKLLLDKWYDKIEYFNNGRYVIKNENIGYNIINSDGKLLSKLWLDEMPIPFMDDFIIKVKGKFNVLEKNGNFMLDYWSDDFEVFDSNSYVMFYGKDKKARVDYNSAYAMILKITYFDKYNKKIEG